MKINNIALIALLSISLINPMQKDKQRKNQLKSILKDAEKRLEREKSKSDKTNKPLVRTHITSKPPLKKTKIAASDDTGNRLSTVPTLAIQTDKDFFERRIQLIKALQQTNKIPPINWEEKKKELSQRAFDMIDAVIEIGKFIGGISHQNQHLQQQDLSPFIIDLMKQHPLLNQDHSPILSISSKASIDKFKGKYQEFESACKAIKIFIPIFPIPQAIKDHHFTNLLESIASFQKAIDFNDQVLIQMINSSFPENIEIFGGFRKDLLNAISQKNKALASEREKKLREPLYPKQRGLMEKIHDNMDQTSLNNIKQEIDKHFPAGNPNWQDLRESLLDVLNTQLTAIGSNEKQQKFEEQQKLIAEQKKIEEQKNDGKEEVASTLIVAVEEKPEVPQKLDDTNKSLIKPQSKTDQKPSDSVQLIQLKSEPLKKESVIYPAKMALFTGLGLAGCLLLYFLYIQALKEA